MTIHETLEQRGINAQPLISVLVPAYKHEKYVLECLESISALNYSNLELILSDDVSPDTTFQIAEKWVKDNRGRFVRAMAVRQPVNLGVVRNLQFLFDQAQGDYVAYIASDDSFTENAISDRISVLLRFGNVDGVIGNSQLIADSGAVLKERRFPPQISNLLSDEDILLRGLIRYWSLTCSSALIRRTALVRGGSIGRLPEGIKIEDRYIFIRLAAQGKLRYVDSVVAKYRQTEGSLSRAPMLHVAGVAGVLECDRANRHLVHGLERALLDLNIISCRIILAGTDSVLYYAKQGALRIASGVIWAMLSLRHTILRGKPKPAVY